MAEQGYVVGVDLGGTRFRVALIDSAGTIHESFRTFTHADQGQPAVMQRIYEAVDGIIAPVGIEQIRGIGFAAPGPTDPWTGVMYNPPNLPDWNNVNVKALMEERFGVPCFVGNDANIAALGEHRFGAGCGTHHMIYITVSTGIGGGVIINDELLLGWRGLAGEVGHITVAPEGPQCGCGNFGCLEAMASGTWVARRAADRLRAGVKSSLTEMTGGDFSRLNTEMIVVAANQGDPFASEVMDEAGTYLGIGCADLINLFNPEMIVIGGGFSQAGPLLFGPLKRTVGWRAMAPLREGVRIEHAALGDDVGVLGAAALALKALNI